MSSKSIITLLVIVLVTLFGIGLSDVCVDMCKELGAYPEKCTCPGYTDTTDKTPGVMTWDELLKYMDDVSSNGHSAIKDWRKQA